MENKDLLKIKRLAKAIKKIQKINNIKFVTVIANDDLIILYDDNKELKGERL